MAFQKKEWLKRIVQFPGRRKLTPSGIDNVYNVERAEGEVLQAGDGFTKENMDDLEERISSGFKDMEPFYGAYSSFPIPGDPNRTYIDNTVDPRLMYTWDPETSTYILTGGAGGADGSSIDIPVTLPAEGWTGEAAPYSQTVTVPQMRETMTPLLYFSGMGDDAQYAYSLITGYEAGYAQMTFYAADLPQVDIPITLKGILAQQLEYADNTLVVVVPADGFILNEDLGRYEQTIAVEGMAAGASGSWDIVRSGEVLTEAESKIALSITDVIPLDGAIKIVCLWEPGQQYMLKLTGTYTQATEGTMLLAGMQGWFDRVGKLEDNLGDKFSADKDYAVGDYCIYEDVLYKFVADKEAGEWDRTKAEPTKVTAELGTLNAKMPTPDYDQIITNIKSTNALWTATEDCFLVGSVSQNANQNVAIVTVNDIRVGSTYVSGGIASGITIFVPVSKDSIVKTNTNGTYDLKAYKIKS